VGHTTSFIAGCTAAVQIPVGAKDLFHRHHVFIVKHFAGIKELEREAAHLHLVPTLGTC